MTTPGYKIENLTKPLECQAIEAGETTYTPEYVADTMLASLARCSEQLQWSPARQRGGASV
jgi:hypothetical protein